MACDDVANLNIKERFENIAFLKYRILQKMVESDFLYIKRKSIQL